MLRKPSRVLLALPAVALICATAACSSGGKPASDANSSAGSGGGGQVAGTPRIKIAMISHAPLGDAFFDTIITGAKAAAAKDNVDFSYSGDGDAAKEATLVQTAIDSKVDGIAVSIPNPDALRSVILKAKAAGIPVVAYNAGDRDWQSTGALSFYGEPEVLSGQAAGDQLNKGGYKHALCVVQAQGQVQLEDRCAGMKQKFSGKVDELFADGTNPSGYVSTISAKLHTDSSIDAVVTLGPALGVAMADAVKKDNLKVAVATYAMNNDVYPLLKNGQIIFTIDQQPWLQGYMSVDSLWFYLKNGTVLGANQSIATGPVVLDKTNAAAVEKYAKVGDR
ncbi:MAG: simple sugar transport system substrate-binding protein [Nocardioidaceae bacterium]|jgi:simple sugar transport system substrate-binding protein|nr:simple sugar transport system substrate-binding protein [Nocardioidaceae bacterium]